MLLALAGVTGVGKSYYKDAIVKKLNFEKLKIITTREMRIGEKNNDDKIFVTKEELQVMKSTGKIGFEFNLLGNTYAYTKAELFTNKNMVFELHYNTVYDFKKVCPDMKIIYIFPKDIEVAKEKLRQRKLTPDVEKKRLLEIDEHYKRVTTDKNLIKMFDYTIYNNYDEESENELINLVKKILIESGGI